MLELKVERINDHVVKETYGIIQHTYCEKCGQTLGFLIFECPNCDINNEIRKEAQHESN